MSFRDEMKSVLRLKALGTSNKEASECIQRIRGSIRKVPRIPSIIKAKKRYSTFRVLTNTGHDLLILVNEDLLGEESSLIDVELELCYEYFTYNEVLKKVLPKEVQTPSSFEIVGSIVHLNLDEEQIKYKDIIGQVVHDKTGRTVITKIGQISNEYRSFDLEVIGGEPVLETVHKEGNVLFYIDYRNVYWCSKLQNERLDLVRKLMEGDVLCDPFCGVGPVSLAALKKGCRVYSNDLNPHAIGCLKKSMKINKLDSRNIEVFNLPASEFLEKMTGRKIDHFFLNLPEHSLDYLRKISTWNGDSRVHCYFFCRSNEDVYQYIFSRIGLQLSPGMVKMVRKVSPSKWMYKLETCCTLLRRGFGLCCNL
ncbi:putative methyltransferase [Encephalitozoon hellem ATCC 50504]|uniref:tRNA (guanine(37)-N1)-methyltransferase n=1 Tax=Encephalitozoon hellem TaxID=27973 RepID=A0A9Q9C2K6_ENCHE|nr:putative methyltransferase [Encephalitozoon hellem ATCC 50504]AFM98103.1 putative methyltransferase [Encephalitozoon hellem ATCC 50504]UTX42946.1 tRNA (guanine(37)-N1)-methyltransferase [Encephalitozoon hellem]WEL38403.1 tRNA (guanine(37)-N1)-methyltransferase [Encephalitozoon hellem]|eukprot:XP_003887084.1 putative methyltransferase [Encephalitozoon hellem ATCC 50504]